MKKVCEIVNGHFSYFLRVNGREIPFSLGCNYFEEHYKSLGYNI